VQSRPRRVMRSPGCQGRGESDASLPVKPDDQAMEMPLARTARMRSRLPKWFKDCDRERIARSWNVRT
jgi:hypothetical protein